MSTNTIGFAWFYSGTGLLAFIVGMLIGVSASPVVAVVVPLLFALLTAGGGLYVILGKDDDSPVSPRARVNRASFMGKQLVAFALGVGLGLWCGVWAKMHSDAVWAVPQSEASAVSDLRFTDPRALAGLVELDSRLLRGSVPSPQRKRILVELYNAMANRSDGGAMLAASDAEAIDAILKPTTSGDEGTEKKRWKLGPVAIEEHKSLDALLDPSKPIG